MVVGAFQVEGHSESHRPCRFLPQLILDSFDRCSADCFPPRGEVLGSLDHAPTTHMLLTALRGKVYLAR